MSQENIIKLLEKKGPLFATQIIENMRHDTEVKESLRGVLKQMRKYKEVRFICIGIHHKNKKETLFNVGFHNGKEKIIKEEKLYKDFPMVRSKRITRKCYLYFSNK